VIAEAVDGEAKAPTRRYVIVAGVGLLAAAAWLVVASGLVVPQLSWQSDGMGGEYAEQPDGISVRQLVPVRNDGWVSATITGAPLPAVPGVDWGEVDGLPATLAPGETHVIEIHAQVDGCDAVVDGYDVASLRAKAAAFLPAISVEVGAPMSRNPATYELERVAESPAAGMVLDQPPSWILDAIWWPCSDASR
jgi:hypothetical protein